MPLQLTDPTPLCPICGGEGEYRYKNLVDHMFGSSGVWHMRQCQHLGCGALWLDPAPNRELLPELYRNYYTHSDPPVADTPLRRFYVRARRAYLSWCYDYAGYADFFDQLLGRLIGLIPSRRDYFDLAAFHTKYIPGGRLLEIGCGSGYHLAELSDRGWVVTGLDADPGAVSQAAAKGLDVRIGTLEANSFPDEAFDVVAMVHVIEHVINPRDLIAECLRVLKPGGRLVIVTPNAASFGASFFGQDWRGLEPPRHIQILTPAAAETLLMTAGFVLERSFTKQRDARNMYRKSLDIRRRRRGRGGMVNGLIRRLAPVLEACGRLALLSWPHSGEELCLVVRKPTLVSGQPQP